MPGWNLVGSISNYGSNSVRFVPNMPGAQIFWYENDTTGIPQYRLTTTVSAGIGYFVVVTGATTFIVQKAEPGIAITPLDWSVPVAVGHHRLVLGAADGATEDIDNSDIGAPPAVPNDDDAYLATPVSWMRRLSTDARSVVDGTSWTLVATPMGRPRSVGISPGARG